MRRSGRQGGGRGVREGGGYKASTDAALFFAAGGPGRPGGATWQVIPRPA